MKERNIHVTICSREAMAKEFIKTWHKAEAGTAKAADHEKIYFSVTKLVKPLSS